MNKRKISKQIMPFQPKKGFISGLGFFIKPTVVCIGQGFIRTAALFHPRTKAGQIIVTVGGGLTGLIIGLVANVIVSPIWLPVSIVYGIYHCFQY